LHQTSWIANPNAAGLNVRILILWLDAASRVDRHGDLCDLVSTTGLGRGDGNEAFLKDGAGIAGRVSGIVDYDFGAHFETERNGFQK
jgi:hypothetical protein